MARQQDLVQDSFTHSGAKRAEYLNKNADTIKAEQSADTDKSAGRQACMKESPLITISGGDSAQNVEDTALFGIDADQSLSTAATKIRGYKGVKADDDPFSPENFGV